ncbi:MAG: ribokinase [Chitinivibrionales bacterium]|nr:ribokinase [Chitinivibrionales bacterium]MBD3395120.1 ribokinase [Chitinivibrionales bacterium]
MRAMRIFNCGSLNIDHVYAVDHAVRQGETIAGGSYAFFAGGKGANQSVAIARAGGEVVHVGIAGPEGRWMVDAMREDGVDVAHVAIADRPGGHAVIQVDPAGQNAIVVYGGTNRDLQPRHVDAALASARSGDALLVQNETSAVEHAICAAANRGLTVCFNPAPMDARVAGYPLDRVSLFVVNETEGEALCGCTEPEEIVDAMLKLYPGSCVILTRGAGGVLYGDAGARETMEGIRVAARDTTAAGDTFIGYFMAGMQAGAATHEALSLANRAGALSVTRAGAQASIPWRREVDSWDDRLKSQT